MAGLFFKEKTMPTKLVDVIADMQEDEALALTKQMLASGTDPQVILDECRAAMEIVGSRFETGKYFLPELILAGEILKEISALIKPLMQTGGVEAKKRGKIIVGTVKGDIHDIGKDIVVFMLDVNGYEVYDLGVDVPTETFVEKVKAINPDVVALSGFLTLAFDSMKETVAAIKAAGFSNVKVMVGGGTVDDHVRVYSGADAYGTDAMVAVSLAKQWIH
jgi:methanogenic corrinoid protein MtbC1